MTQQELKLTELDYAIADHHTQMLKAAIPYLEPKEQRTLSAFVKVQELAKTIHFFDDNDMGMMSVCSLDSARTSPTDMLKAVKPYATQREQDIIDVLEKFVASRQTRSGRFPFSLDQIRSLMTPEQQSRFETIQLMMQTLGQN